MKKAITLTVAVLIPVAIISIASYSFEVSKPEPAPDNWDDLPEAVKAHWARIYAEKQLWKMDEEPTRWILHDNSTQVVLLVLFHPQSQRMRDLTLIGITPNPDPISGVSRLVLMSWRVNPDTKVSEIIYWDTSMQDGPCVLDHNAGYEWPPTCKGDLASPDVDVESLPGTS
ncbi:MAG: hypothetical protein ACE5JL_09600 [Dehalococcoidia bacterium]